MPRTLRLPILTLLFLTIASPVSGASGNPSGVTPPLTDHLDHVKHIPSIFASALRTRCAAGDFAACAELLSRFSRACPGCSIETDYRIREKLDGFTLDYLRSAWWGLAIDVLEKWVDYKDESMTPTGRKLPIQRPSILDHDRDGLITRILAVLSSDYTILPAFWEAFLTDPTPDRSEMLLFSVVEKLSRKAIVQNTLLKFPSTLRDLQRLSSHVFDSLDASIEAQRQDKESSLDHEKGSGSTDNSRKHAATSHTVSPSFQVPLDLATRAAQRATLLGILPDMLSGEAWSITVAANTLHVPLNELSFLERLLEEVASLQSLQVIHGDLSNDALIEIATYVPHELGIRSFIYCAGIKTDSLCWGSLNYAAGLLGGARSTHYRSGLEAVSAVVPVLGSAVNKTKDTLTFMRRHRRSLLDRIATTCTSPFETVEDLRDWWFSESYKGYETLSPEQREIHREMASENVSIAEALSFPFRTHVIAIELEFWQKLANISYNVPQSSDPDVSGSRLRSPSFDRSSLGAESPAKSVENAIALTFAAFCDLELATHALRYEIDKLDPEMVPILNSPRATLRPSSDLVRRIAQCDLQSMGHNELFGTFSKDIVALARGPLAGYHHHELIIQAQRHIRKDFTNIKWDYELQESPQATNCQICSKKIKCNPNIGPCGHIYHPRCTDSLIAIGHKCPVADCRSPLFERAASGPPDQQGAARK